MKLASLYTSIAHKLPNNGLYEYYQTFFLDGMREPEDRVPRKEYIDFEKYQYELSDSEKEFYEKIYIPQGRILEAKEHVVLEEFFRESQTDITFGEHIKDLMDFVKISKNLGLLIAPIGWGKTVLLRYTWFYLISKSAALQSKIIPIYISIDHNRNIFIDKKDPKQIREDFLQHILRERLIDVARPFTTLDDNLFWNYLMKGSDQFNSLEQYEEDIQTIYRSNSTKLKELIRKARMEARQSNDFYYTTLRYIRDEVGRLPILIFDNVDTLPLEVNQVILDEAIFLSKEYNVKVLICMRTSTYAKIEETHDSSLRAYPPAIIEMEKPDVRNYIRKRTFLVKQKIRESKPQFRYINYEGDIRVTFRDGGKVFDSMLEMLLGEESLNILSFLAHFNLRKINSLVMKYLSTGYVDDHMLVKKIIGEEVLDERYSKSPLWILLSSVITNNHKTRFSEVGMAYQEGVLNLYCNGRRNPKQYMIRIHILSYIKRHRDPNMQEIISAYLNLYMVPNSMTEGIKYAVWRMLSFELLESPDFYKVERFEDMDRVKTVSITETGNYYRQEFRNYYEYLIYMKDDVELIDNPYDIQDCIKIGELSGRLNEVHKFLHMIYESEKEFLFGLTKNQRRLFLKDFSVPEDTTPFIVKSPLERLIHFGKSRLDKSDISNSSKEI